MKELERLKEGLALFPAGERAALMEAMRAGQIAPPALVRLAAARRRTVRKARSDAQTDSARRILVGARVPRERAEQYRECAAVHGLSLYRFIYNALEREYRRLTK